VRRMWVGRRGGWRTGSGTRDQDHHQPPPTGFSIASLLLAICSLGMAAYELTQPTCLDVCIYVCARVCAGYGLAIVAICVAVVAVVLGHLATGKFKRVPGAVQNKWVAILGWVSGYAGGALAILRIVLLVMARDSGPSFFGGR